MFRFLIVVFMCLTHVASASDLVFQNGFRDTDPGLERKVSVELAVMSKCPDAHLCEAVWDHVVDKVYSLMDVNLIYIARSPDKCMHGPEECAGNIQQLCAFKHWAHEHANRPDWWSAWNFVQCMNYGDTTRIGSEAYAKECATAVKKAWTGRVAECASGPEGKQLLRESIATVNSYNVTKSCTILLNQRPVCIHDNTWKDCPGGHQVDDFIRQVREESRRINN